MVICQTKVFCDRKGWEFSIWTGEILNGLEGARVQP